MDSICTLGLLDMLAARSGCQYLSDLVRPGQGPLIGDILRKVEPNQFSLREWNDAASYLTRRPCNFAAPEQAKDFLLQYRWDEK